MVQLPDTAAIEYVAAGHFFPGGRLAGGTFGRGGCTELNAQHSVMTSTNISLATATSQPPMSSFNNFIRH